MGLTLEATQIVAWEYPCDVEQGQNFLALLAAVRIYLPDDQYVLTAMLPAGLAVLQCIDVAQAAGYLDYFNLMAYDFAGHWSPKTAHQSQLYAMQKDESSGSGGVKYLMSQGVPAKRILLGIPVFGRSFLQASGPGQNFQGTGGTTGVFEYNQLPRPKTKEVVDKRSVGAMCVGGDGGFVTYDNPDTVKTKAEFCKQKGLGVSFPPASASIESKSRPAILAVFDRQGPSMIMTHELIEAGVVLGTFLLDRPCGCPGQVEKPDRGRLPYASHFVPVASFDS